MRFIRNSVICPQTINNESYKDKWSKIKEFFGGGQTGVSGEPLRDEYKKFFWMVKKIVIFAIFDVFGVVLGTF